MDKINILNKVGMLTNEDRKMPLTHGCNYFKFQSCIDLSIGVKVIPYGNATLFSVNDYSKDLASFFCWWEHQVMKDLNGFNGFSNINFELVGFELVNK